MVNSIHHTHGWATTFTINFQESSTKFESFACSEKNMEF